MKSLQILLFVLLQVALLSGQTPTSIDLYLGNKAFLELFQRSGRELNPVQVNRNKEHCLQGCINGECYAEHGVFECICRKNWFGVDCSEHICDKPELNPCQSDGKCIPDGDDFLCLCPTGFTGEFCNYTTAGNACCSNPCYNGGTCYNNLVGGYNCSCLPGYYGPRCETERDSCAGPGVEYCYGNGICRIIYRGNDGDLFPFCYCFDDYDPGFKCRFLSHYNVCRFEPEPCGNGMCHYIAPGGRYSCECSPETTGVNCSETFDPCDPNPCANGGTCERAYGGHHYRCNCPENYGGYTCEGVYIEFNGVVYPNNSAIPLSQVGGGANGVYCRTNNKPCCGDPGVRQGEFYYPNGTIVAIEEDGGDFYRDRGYQFLRLNRRILASNSASGAGKYRCEIPDEWNNTRQLYVTLK